MMAYEYAKVRIDVGSKVWYKGGTSGLDSMEWELWEVVKKFEPFSSNPILVLRRMAWGKSKVGPAKWDYALVDMLWKHCFPDIPRIRKMVVAWNKAKHMRERIDGRVEIMEQKIPWVNEKEKIHEGAGDGIKGAVGEGRDQAVHRRQQRGCRN
jgi:hypothetical protein